jgi:hypothetical protein
MIKLNRHLLCPWAMLLCSAVVAQEPPPDPSEPDASKPAAGLRAWIFSPGDESVAILCKTAADEQPRTLATATGPQRVTDGTYQEFAPGRIELQVKGGDRVLATASGSLADGRQYTVVAMPEGRDWKIKVFSDGPAKSGSGFRPLRVCNFAADRETVLLLPGAGETRIAANTLHELEVAPAVTGLTVRVLAADGGPPAQSSTEIDFVRAPSAYVVVGPDYRGRMRPRVIEGGSPPPEPAEPAAGPDAGP